MTPVRRQQLLDALGIERWVRRLPAVAGPVAAATGAGAREAPAEAPRRERAGPQGLPNVAPAAPLQAPPGIPPLPQAAERPAVVPAADWAALREQVSVCRACKLCETRTQAVFGVGAQHAPLMIVGEGPGADEDAQGEPFVGRAGKLLDEMLRAIGHSRQQSVYIANVVKCRPPGNRDPEADEVEACRPYLEQQIRLLKPKLIVGLGRIAAQRLLNTDAPLSRLRGPVHTYGEAQIPVLITYHPAYLLRSPREKAKSWEDLKRIHQLLAAAS